MAKIITGSGPFELNQSNVEGQVQPASIGNYALGVSDRINATFDVRYIGRSDKNLRQRLLDHVAERKHSHFVFTIAQSDVAAYRRECEDFHDHRPTLNERHPDTPDGSILSCAVEGCDGT